MALFCNVSSDKYWGHDLKAAMKLIRLLNSHLSYHCGARGFEPENIY